MKSLFNTTLLLSLAGYFAGADYENKQINVYRITGPRVFEDWKVSRPNQDSPQTQAPESPDEILYRVIDTEIKRSGQLVYESNFTPSIHEYADKLQKLFPGLRIALVHAPFSEWPRSWLGSEVIDGKRQIEYLDENSVPEKYKVMTEEDHKQTVSDFFAGHYDLLLCGGSYYNIHRLYERDGPNGKPPVLENLPIRVKSGVKGAKWKLRNGIWRAKTPYASYEWGEYAVEPADEHAVQVIENLFGKEK
jgi:hypothetical protein